MALLYLLQSIRNVYIDYAALVFLVFGSELFFLCTTAVIFWSFSKKAAYKLIFAFTLFSPVILLANLIVRSPFPFVSAQGLSVPDIISRYAAGYSLPSIGIFTITVLCAGIFINNLNISVKISCIAAAALTVFSYLYLGLCTTWSAAASLILGAAASFVFTKFADGTLFDIRQYPVYLLISSIPTFVMIVVSVSIYLSGIITLEAFSGALRIAGMNLALLFSWFFESNFVRFSIRCSSAAIQLRKCFLGTAATLITWFGLYTGLHFIPGFWPAAFISNVIVTVGAFSAYPILIRRVFSSGSYS